jgi:serine/threonine-protein kinase
LNGEAFKKIERDYRIVREIGKGGMSVVYEGYQPSLKRKVAIKVLQKDRRNPEIFQRFFSEALALAKLSHESIVDIIDLIDEDDASYIIMEFIDGKTLSEIIKKFGPLSYELAGSIGLKIANALQHIHEVGIVHRDLKPGNIMITPNGTVKVMDFGIAHNPDVLKGLTRTGVMMGTPSYMSPEQVRGEKVDARSDIFSFGAVLYEMVCGKKAFDAETEGKLIEKILRANYISPRFYRKKIPRALVKIISKCLKRKPAQRYESVKELIRDLEYFLLKYRVSNPTRIIGEFMRSPDEFVKELESTEFRMKLKTIVNGIIIAIILGAMTGFILKILNLWR